MNPTKNTTLLSISAMALLAISPMTFAAPPIDAGKAPGHLIIRAMDTNEDGVISREEFKPLKRGSRLDTFVAADVNQDNELTREELEAYLDTRPSAQREQALNKFEGEDLNGDGKVTLTEIHDQMFAELDVDGNGELNADEVGPERQERRGNVQK